MTRSLTFLIVLALVPAIWLSVTLAGRVDDTVELAAVSTNDTTSTTSKFSGGGASDRKAEGPVPTTSPVVESDHSPSTGPVPPAAPRVQSASVAELERIIRDGFSRFGPVVAEEAVDQAWCETGGTLDPSSTGSQGEVGLLQIHPKYHTGRAAKFGWTMNDLYNPAKNVVVAADLYGESGWSQWTCQP